MTPDPKTLLAPKGKASFWDDHEEYQRQNTVISPLERRIVGALYGALLGALYPLVAGTINVILFRDLPLRLDWPAVQSSMLPAGAAGLALGVITCWSNDRLKGILVGALVIPVSGAVRALIFLSSETAVMAIILLYTFLPFVALSLPIALVLRLIANRYEHNLQNQGRSRLVSQGILLAAVVALAAFLGSWSQMPPASVEAVRKVHRMLQTTLSSPADKPLPLALRSISDFRSRAGGAYLIDQRESLAVAGGVDVRITFDNGYVLSCLVEGQTLSVTCAEGESLFGPFQFNPNDQR